MRTLIVGLIGLCGPALLTAPVPKEQPKTNADKVVGTWRLVKSSNGGDQTAKLEVELTRDGKMAIRQWAGGEEPSVREGTYKVEGDKLPYSVSGGGMESSETLTIKTLTEDKLAVVDPDGVTEEFERVKKK